METGTDSVTILYSLWITPLIVGIVSVVGAWTITNQIKAIRNNQVRKDNSDRLMEIKLEAIAYAMGKQPPPIGPHFTEEYEYKKDEMMKEEKFLDHNKTTT